MGAFADAGQAPGGGGGGFSLPGEGIGKKILGTAMEALQAPQQIVYGLGGAAAGLATGDTRSAVAGLKHAAGEALSLGQARGNWDFAQAAGTTDAEGKRIGTKLPTGLNTAAGLVLDPLLFTGVGKGAEAREGVTVLGRLLSMEPEAVSKGLAEGTIDLSKASPTRHALSDAIAQHVLENAPRAQKLVEAGRGAEAGEFAAKQGEKIAKLTARRGAGGLTAFVPGTELSKTLISGEKLGAAGEKIGQTALKIPGAAKAADVAGHIFNPIHETTQAFGKDVAQRLHALTLGKQSALTSLNDQTVTELANAAQTVGRAITPEDTADMLHAIETGATSVAGKPELDTAMQALGRIGDETTREQVARGLIGSEGNLPAREAAHAQAKQALADQEAVVKQKQADLKLARQQARRNVTAVGRTTTESANLKNEATQAGKLARKAERDLAKEQAKLDALKAEWVAQAKGDINQEITTFRTPEEVVAAQHRVEDLHGQIQDASAQAEAEVERRMNAGESFEDAIAAVQPQMQAIEPLKAERDALFNRLDTANNGHGILPQEAMQWDPMQARIFKLGLSPEQLAHDGSYVTAPGTVVAVRDGEVAGIMTLDNQFGIIIESDPAFHGTGIGREMKDAAEAAGENVQGLAGKSGFTPMGAASAAARRAHEAANVLDFSTARSERLAEKAKQAGEAYEQAKHTADISKTDLSFMKAQAAAAQKESDQALKDLVRERAKHNAAKAAEKKAGRAVEEAKKTNFGVRANYAQRLPTDEAKAAAETRKYGSLATEVAGSTSGALAQGAEKARSVFPDMPVQQINELVAEAQAGNDIRPLLSQPKYSQYLKGLSPDQIEKTVKHLEGVASELPEGAKLYQENAFTSVLNRRMSANRAIVAHDYVQELKGISTHDGNPILMDAEQLAAHKAANGGELPTGWVEKELPHLGRIAAPKELLHEMEGVVGRVSADDFPQKIYNAMGKWRDFWKVHATTGMLGAMPFAMRNARSNVFLMVADGYTPDQIGKAMKEAYDLESKIRTVVGSARVSGKFVGEHAEDVAKRGVEAVLRDKLTPHEFQLWQDMQKHGITTSGFFNVDYAPNASEIVKHISGEKEQIGKAQRVGREIFSARGTTAQMGRRFNSAIETNARMTHFLMGLDRYGSVEKAAERTKAVLFDYNDLSSSEQKVIKNIIPFYTFMRKNIPLQFRTLVENPSRVAIPEKISGLFTEGLPESAPDYQKEGGYRQIKKGLPFAGTITNPDRPFYAATDVLSPLVALGRGQGAAAARDLANVVGGPQIGLVKALTEVGTKKDTFTGGNVRPGAASAAQRLIGSQLPSLSRVPRVELPGKASPARALSGKKPLPAGSELLKFLTGIRTQRSSG